MADATRDRMMKTAARTTTKARPAPAFIEAPKPYPHRLTLDLSTDDYDTVRDLAHHRRMRMADVMRCVVARLREDPRLAAELLGDA